MRTGPDRGALLVVALGLAALAVSAYLTLAHYGSVGLACQQGSLVDCEAVTTSTYSLVPGTQLPITVPGMAWSLLVVALGLALARGAGRAAELILLVGAAVAMLGVLYLVRAEIVVIGRICLWCTIFHALILATLLVALLRIQRESPDQPHGVA